jgi:hypothetical protein
MSRASSSSRCLCTLGTHEESRGIRWPPERMRCGNFQGLRAGLGPRGGETAIDDFSVGDNLPVPVASRTVPGDPIRKRVFRNHDARLKNQAGARLVSQSPRLIPLPKLVAPCSCGTSDGGLFSSPIVTKVLLGVCPVPGIVVEPADVGYVNPRSPQQTLFGAPFHPCRGLCPTEGATEPGMCKPNTS